MLESAFYKLLSSCDSNTGAIKCSIWLQHTCVEDLKIQALLDLSSITIPKSFSQYYEGSARREGMPREAGHCMTSRIFRRKTIDSRFPGSVLTIPSAESPNRRELQYKLGALAVYVHSTPPCPPQHSQMWHWKRHFFYPLPPFSHIKPNTPLPYLVLSANPIAPFPDPRV